MRTTINTGEQRERMITLDSVVVRSSDLLANRLDDELIMMSLGTGKYYGLDDIGTRIWELCAAPVSVRSLVDQLQKEFSVVRQTCEQDCLELLNQMVEEKLIQV